MLSREKGSLEQAAGDGTGSQGWWDAAFELQPNSPRQSWRHQGGLMVGRAVPLFLQVLMSRPAPWFCWDRTLPIWLN